MSRSSRLSAVARVVRQHDHDRFLAALFAPAECREALFALYAFNHEIAKIAEIVSEPPLGRIRLQWWRENLDAIYSGAPLRQHEILGALAAAIRDRGLSRHHFDRLLAARELDLEGGAPASMAALAAYAENSSAGLVWLTLETLGERGETVFAAGRSVGIAYALCGLLRAVPFHAGHKRLYLPRDLVEAAAMRPERELFELKSTAGLRRVVEQIAREANRHLGEARALRAALPRAALPALLPAVLVRADLVKLAGAAYDPFDRRVARRDAWRSWRLALAAWRRRY